MLQRLHVTGAYAFCTLVWGSSYFAVRHQIGDVQLEISLIYRLGIAGLVFFGLLAIHRRWQALALSDHLTVAAFGLCNLAFSYLLLYWATAEMTSAYVVIIFSTKVIMTACTTSVLLRKPFEGQVAWGGLVGILGVVVLLAPSFMDHHQSISAKGVLFAVAGTFITSLGDVASARSSQKGINPIQANALGFLYATASLLLLALVFGWKPGFSLTPTYLASLAYLAVFASVLAWIFYLDLVGAIGPARAGYMVALFPTVGAICSVLFEGLPLTLPLVVGACLAAGGNLIAMRPHRAERSGRRAPASLLPDA